MVLLGHIRMSFGTCGVHILNVKTLVDISARHRILAGLAFLCLNLLETVLNLHMNNY